MKYARRADGNQPEIVAALRAAGAVVQPLHTKVCADCKEAKDRSEFHADKVKRDGLKSYCKTCHNRRGRESKKKHADKVAERNKEYRERNRDWIRDRHAKARHDLRAEVMARFGTKCAQCGFPDDRALQFDHVNSDGAKDRKDGFDWWSFLKRLSAMDDQELFANFQLLCANCNQIKRVVNSEYGLGKKSRRESARNCCCTKGSRSGCPVHA